MNSRVPPQLAIAFVLSCGLFHDSHASAWSVDHSRSTLGFIATYDGVGFEARFRKFSAVLVFDPQRPGEGLFDVTVDIATVDSQSSDRDEGMLEREWFDAKRFPTSRFISREFRQLSSTEFEVSGSLTIKGTTHSISLPFQWVRDEQGVRMRGKTMLQRTRFNIGTGEWETDPTIGFDVQVIVDFRLREHS